MWCYYHSHQVTIKVEKDFSAISYPQQTAFLPVCSQMYICMQHAYTRTAVQMDAFFINSAGLGIKPHIVSYIAKLSWTS